MGKVLSDNADMESSSIPVERFPHRRYIADTDEGRELQLRREALQALLAAYRDGRLPEGRQS